MLLFAHMQDLLNLEVPSRNREITGIKICGVL